MFELYQNKNFNNISEFKPFNQMYYLFYKKKLKRDSANLTRKIKLINLMTLLIRRRKFEVLEQKIVDHLKTNSQYICILEKRIKSKFNFSEVKLNFNQLKSFNTANNMKLFENLRDQLIRILIISELFLPVLRIIKRDIKSEKRNQKLKTSFSTRQKYRESRDLLIEQKKELKKFTKFIKKEIKKPCLRILKRNSNYFSKNHYRNERKRLYCIFHKIEPNLPNDFNIYHKIDNDYGFIKNEYDIFNINDLITSLESNETHEQNSIFNIRLKSENPNQISQFNRDIRKIICELIYYKISRGTQTNTELKRRIIYGLKFKDLDQFLENKFPKTYLDEISNKLNKDDFEIPVKNYIEDLFGIVYKMYSLNKDNKFINFSRFVAELIEEGITLGATERGLETIIPEIYVHLKNSFNNEFKLKRARRKSSKIPKSAKRSIEFFSKKLKLSREIYNGLYDGKCVSKNCIVDFKLLPALEFHHKNTNNKISTFNDIAYKKYDDIKAELSVQQVELICNNCHSCKDSTTFNNYKELVMQENLFYDDSGHPNSPKIINDIIDTYILEKLRLDNRVSDFHKRRYDVKVWIKKRYIIEKLFNGQCINCGEQRLPSLEFHHVKPESKQKVWGDIFRIWNTRKIIYDFIIKEGCVCLCANCHSLINSPNFKNYCTEILEIEDKSEILEIYNKLEKNILEFYEKVRNEYSGIHFDDPLKKLFEKGDTWKETLIHIYYLSSLKKGFTNKELNIIIGKHVKVNKLLNKGYIRKKGKIENAFVYNICNKGRIEALNLIRLLKKENPIDFMELEKEILNKLKHIN